MIFYRRTRARGCVTLRPNGKHILPAQMPFRYSAQEPCAGDVPKTKFGTVRVLKHRGGRMPNIASVLRDEIKRLSRQQSRTQIDPTRKATAVHRRDIALLKRQVVLLERQVKSLMRRPSNTSSA